MAGLRGVFFDTSVLVAGLIDFGPSSQHPFSLMDAVADGRIERPQTAWHCCLEYYSVTTRLPEGSVSSRSWPYNSCGRRSEDLQEGFLVSASGEGTTGGRIYDAHIAEIARQAGAQLVVTENRRHFTSLLRYGIRVLVSAELVQEVGP